MKQTRSTRQQTPSSPRSSRGLELGLWLAGHVGHSAAFHAVQPIVAGKQPVLARTIDARFADVAEALAPYKSGFGFVPYTDLTRADTRKLSRAIDALAEPLSNVAALVAGAQ